MHKTPKEELKESVLGFVQKYGFLGFITALPTTADFIAYESVYLPKNLFIKEESLSTESYLSYFYPFARLDFRKSGMKSGWSVTDRERIAITMAMGNAPQAVTMKSQKEYVERYDWLIRKFTDLAFNFMTSFLYYLDYDTIAEQTRDLYRQGISAFGGISPTYRIDLEKDLPVIVWDFQEKRKRGTQKMIENRNVNIITDADGKKLVLINDIRFKAKVRDDGKVIEEYLKEYIGEFYEIEETSEKVYISTDFPDEYASSESRIALKGAVAKAKANAAQAIPELIRTATNPKHEVNRKEKHTTDAMFGWYRYDIRFALPVYDDKTGKIARHNIYSASMLVRHADNGQKYLYDILAIKKKRAARLSDNTVR